MAENIDLLLRELAEIYDTQSRNVYISVYFNKGSYVALLRKRQQAVQDVLTDEERDNFTETMKKIHEHLKKIQWTNIAVFGSHMHDYLTYTLVPVPVTNLLVVDSSPYIRPLARIKDEWESYTLVLISFEYAKIYSVTLGEVDREKKLGIDLMNKHKKGGCSQARFQRLRQGAIHAFFSDVIEALDKVAEQQIILAGPGEAKKQFYTELPQHLQERVSDTVDISVDDEQDLFAEASQLMRDHEQNKGHEAVQQLKAEILKEGLAVYGLNETLTAVQNGQVDLLLIQKDYKPKGWLCEHCQLVQTESSKRCPNCKGPVSEVDIIEEILEFAERTDAHVEFTDDETLQHLGHVGALLRYK